MSTESFFTDAAPPSGPRIPRHRRHKTPWIRHADDAAPAPELAWDDERECWVLANQRRDAKRGGYFTRASSFADPVADKLMIERAMRRRVVWAMARHPELLMRAQACVDLEADRGELDAIAALAASYGRGDEAAMQGTAFHRMRELRDAGHPMDHLPPLLLEGLAAWERITSCFRLVASETFVVNYAHSAAGTFDALFEVARPITIAAPDGTVLGALAPGDRIIGDLKSGRWGPEWFGVSYAVQALLYATGRPYSHEDGAVDWPDGVAPRTDWAVIPYVHHGDPSTAGLHWVDLRAAALRVPLIAAVKVGRCRDDLFVAHVEQAPATPRPGAALSEFELLRRIDEATSLEELNALYAAVPAVWSPRCGEHASARLAALGIPMA